MAKPPEDEQDESVSAPASGTQESSDVWDDAGEAVFSPVDGLMSDPRASDRGALYRANSQSVDDRPDSPWWGQSDPLERARASRWEPRSQRGFDPRRFGGRRGARGRANRFLGLNAESWQGNGPVSGADEGSGPLRGPWSNDPGAGPARRRGSEAWPAWARWWQARGRPDSPLRGWGRRNRAGDTDSSQAGRDQRRAGGRWRDTGRPDRRPRAWWREDTGTSRAPERPSDDASEDESDALS